MTRYKLRQRLFSLGEDYDIEDADGRNVFFVDGKLFRIRKTFVIEDRQGRGTDCALPLTHSVARQAPQHRRGTRAAHRRGLSGGILRSDTEGPGLGLAPRHGKGVPGGRVQLALNAWSH